MYDVRVGVRERRLLKKAFYGRDNKIDAIWRRSMIQRHHRQLGGVAGAISAVREHKGGAHRQLRGPFGARRTDFQVLRLPKPSAVTDEKTPSCDTVPFTSF